MIVRSAVKRMCRECRVVRRRRILRIVCKKNPRHKQRQGLHTQAATPFTPARPGARPAVPCTCGSGSCPRHPMLPVSLTHPTPSPPSAQSVLARVLGL